MSEDFVLEEDNPLSPSSVAMILNNLFRKESNGDPIDFYLRRSRLRSRQSDEDLITKLEKLKTVIEVISFLCHLGLMLLIMLYENRSVEVA